MTSSFCQQTKGFSLAGIEIIRRHHLSSDAKKLDCLTAKSNSPLLLSDLAYCKGKHD